MTSSGIDHDEIIKEQKKEIAELKKKLQEATALAKVKEEEEPKEEAAAEPAPEAPAEEGEPATE